ncbi:acetoacetate--CoA ligase [Dankookia sp. P2]|uniref:acetoacetate--CoA ligase n=1 Tax=Dankookia sp. P2 TaxID=3423955 RepID=UPI003D67C68A
MDSSVPRSMAAHDVSRWTNERRTTDGILDGYMKQPTGHAAGQSMAATSILAMHAADHSTVTKPQLVAAVTYLPDPAAIEHSQLTQFVERLRVEADQEFDDYKESDRFSAADFRTFWSSFWRWSKLPHEGALEPVCVGDTCEAAVFFPRLRLNYTECLLQGDPDRPALTACHAEGRYERLTFGELHAKVARLSAALLGWGIGPGDRIAAVARNNAEVVIVALAAAAVGAVVATCTPDMGAFAIRSRLAPLSPKLLFVNLAPQPWDLGSPVADRIAELLTDLPTLVAVVALDVGVLPPNAAATLHRLADLLRDGMPEHRAWPRLPFNHPLFIMFSSGTTGTPKCILHGAGGTLIEHVKEHRLHCDLQEGDKLFFQTSCGWMMWNWQLSALASGAEIMVYDGPLDRLDTFWHLLSEHGVTVFGTNPAYLQYCEALGYSPRSHHDLSKLRSILSTGSVLYPRQFHWVGKEVKDLPLQSISGGTDIIGCFVLGNPNLPVHAGEAQCRSLGLDVRVLPPADDPRARTGELICAGPFPSRPLGFYGDADGARFHRSYFAANPGVWTHGDLIERTPYGGWKLHGRSDNILNIRGIRVGPGEIYAILKDFDEIAEAMAIAKESEEEPGGVRLVLLVVLRRGAKLDAALSKRIRAELARRGSAALVPAQIVAVDALPVTLSGKQSEVAAREAANGRPVQNRDALRNPESLDQIAARLACPEEVVQSTAAATVEARLTALCGSVLGLPALEPADNLLEQGADSLRVLNLLLSIEKEFGRSLRMSTVLAAPTIAGLARHLQDLAGRGPGAGERDVRRAENPGGDAGRSRSSLPLP